MNSDLSVSIIVPCFNEEKNVRECIAKIPNIGLFTEIIVVDDGSNDRIKDVIKEVMKQDTRVTLVSLGAHSGKAKATKAGFQHAKGDLVMLLDADMSVDPGELHRFYQAFKEKEVDLMIGTRFIYPFKGRAMKKINQISNRLAAVIFSWLLNTKITDTLCGTKVLRRADAISMDIGHCRWGDFDILEEAAKRKFKVAELPVHYYVRKAGKSSMRAFPDGFLLYKRCLEIIWELKIKRKT